MEPQFTDWSWMKFCKTHQSNIAAEILKQKPETELHCLLSQNPASWINFRNLVRTLDAGLFLNVCFSSNLLLLIGASRDPTACFCPLPTEDCRPETATSHHVWQDRQLGFYDGICLFQIVQEVGTILRIICAVRIYQLVFSIQLYLPRSPVKCTPHSPGTE